MSRITTTYANGAIPGQVNNLAGLTGLVMTGYGSLAFNTPYTVYSLADAIAKGFTAAAEPFAFRHISGFYAEAPNGTPFWVMLVPATTTLANMTDKTNTTNGAIVLRNAAGGLICNMGVARNPSILYKGTITVTAAGSQGDTWQIVAGGVTLGTATMPATPITTTAAAAIVAAINANSATTGASASNTGAVVTVYVPYALFTISSAFTVTITGTGTNTATAIALIAYTPTGSAQMIDSDSISAITNAQQLVLDSQTSKKYMRMQVEGRVIDVTNSTIYAPNTQTCNGVSMVIGGELNDGSAAMGYVLGRIAKNNPVRKISCVEDGAIPLTGSMYIGNATVDSLASSGLLKTLGGLDVDGGKGYICPVTYAQTAGYFWSNDRTCVANSDDYASLARGRVIDACAVIAYQTFVQLIDKDFELDNTGNLSAGDKSSIEGKIDNAVNLNMGSQITSFSSSIDAPNLASTGTGNVTLQIQPKGYLSTINITIGYTAKAA